MTESLRLPYDFDPVPRWVRVYFREGRIGSDERELLSTLYGLAPTSALRRGGEFQLRLEALLADVDGRAFRRATEHRRALDALYARLKRAKKKGLLTYRVAGNPTSGYRYMVLLPSEQPQLASEKRPTSFDASRPTSTAPETQAETGEPENLARAASDLPRGQKSQSRPTSDVSRPTSPSEGIDAAEREGHRSAPSGDASRPTSTDVLDETTTLSEERLVLGPTPSRGRAREDEHPGRVDFEALGAGRCDDCYDEAAELASLGSRALCRRCLARRVNVQMRLSGDLDASGPGAYSEAHS